LAPRDDDVRAALEMAEAGKLADAAKRLQGAIARIDRDAALQDHDRARVARSAAGRSACRGCAPQYGVLAAWADQRLPRGITGSSAGQAEILPTRTGARPSAALFFEAGRSAPGARAPSAWSGAASDKPFAAISWRARMDEKRAASTESRAGYRRLTDIRPVPPPRWSSRSAAEVGTMLEL
jgi:hypothetical protein